MRHCGVDCQTLYTLVKGNWPMLQWLNLSGNYLDAAAFIALSGRDLHVVQESSIVQAESLQKRWCTIQAMQVSAFRSKSGFLMRPAIFRSGQ